MLPQVGWGHYIQGYINARALNAVLVSEGNAQFLKQKYGRPWAAKSQQLP